MRDCYDRLKKMQGLTVDDSLTIRIVGVNLTARTKPIQDDLKEEDWDDHITG